MPDDTDASRLAGLAEHLAQSSTEESTAHEVVQRALANVPDADLVSVTLTSARGEYTTLAASDDLARRLDELQYSLHEGPCVDAADNHDWYRSGSIGHDPRWPRWGPEAAAQGVGSLLSIRLVSGEKSIGALNFYALATGRFDDRDEIDFALLYAVHVAIALASTRQVSGLTTAIHSRHTIGMAQGILMERFGMDISQSFSLLTRLSTTTNTKLSAVAREIVRTGAVPGIAADVTS